MSNDKLAEALRDAVFVAAMLDAICETDGTVDRMKARDAACRVREALQALAAEKRRAREGVTDEMVKQACRALCVYNHWDPDEPVTYSGTHKFVREKDGSIVRQWQMHISNVRAALEAVWPYGRDAKEEQGC